MRDWAHEGEVRKGFNLRNILFQVLVDAVESRKYRVSAKSMLQLKDDMKQFFNDYIKLPIEIHIPLVEELIDDEERWRSCRLTQTLPNISISVHRDEDSDSDPIEHLNIINIRTRGRDYEDYY